MMKLLALCVVVVVMLQLPNGGEAECCRKHSFKVYHAGQWHHGDVCGDCSLGTPYCSHGGCNIFGCNCDGGCRSGLCNGSKFAHQKRNLAVRSQDAHDLIRSADLNGDGMMSLEEAQSHLEHSGMAMKEMKRSMKNFDTNNDNFLSAQEIETGAK